MALETFHPLIQRWFQSRFAGPTEPQLEGWPHIAAGRNTLIAAPTGSGKTLTAFLAAIDRLLKLSVAGELTAVLRVVYVSPLRALSNDMQRNLQKPLEEILALATEEGLDIAPIRVGLRTGDTSAKDRAALTRHPPHILVTTPESLYLLLTGKKSRERLRHVETVIVDEIHALVRDKRGSHLALTLERLVALCERPPQRVGLSATQRPIEVMAEFLIGSHVEGVSQGSGVQISNLAGLPNLKFEHTNPIRTPFQISPRPRVRGRGGPIVACNPQPSRVMRLLRCAMLLFCGVLVTSTTAFAADPLVNNAQQQRVETIEKIAPSVVAVFAPGGAGGGSGVLISADGLALSNFHVTSGVGDFMKCGLNDGVLYDAVIVGVDPSGDVALIKLFGREDFPHAKLGDSDLLQAGDWTFVLGNPFLLATDFQPTVTYGIISGVHRYQYPAAGNILEYTDCIQVDTSINPGNSGGPLFNSDGELVGINGRGSFEKRGRVNSGAGYAISINQIKHFLDHLKSGRIVDHATLGATVATDEDGNVTVTDILEDSEAYYRGLRRDDQIVSFGGRAIGSTNQFKNVLGIYPKGWKLPIVYSRKGEKTEIWVRLRGLHQLSELTGEKQEGPRPQPKPPEPDEKQPKDDKAPREGQPEIKQPAHGAPPVPEHLKKFHVKKTAFANHYFNQIEQDRVLKGLAAWGKFDDAQARWKLTGRIGEKSKYEATLADSGAGLFSGKDAFLQEFSDLSELRDEPPGTGGLLTAWHHLRLLLSRGPKGFTDFYYLGSEPFDGQGETVDVLVAGLAGAESHWYFSRQSGTLLGYDFIRGENLDRCEIRFTALQDVSGKKFPKAFKILHGGLPPVLYHVDAVEFAAPGSDGK